MALMKLRQRRLDGPLNAVSYKKDHDQQIVSFDSDFDKENLNNQ